MSCVRVGRSEGEREGREYERLRGEMGGASSRVRCSNGVEGCGAGGRGDAESKLRCKVMVRAREPSE